jgi:archaellum biogenesis protein FlaJ (TadC family)
MPQATDELRAKFPGDDSEALEVIQKNFYEVLGVISKKEPLYEPTQREWDAIDYLFHEWDYEYKEIL